jgi:GTPase SAR1 family protein
MKIAIIGTPGSGKSTLVFSLASFFKKKGFKTGSANFDFKAKKLKFHAFFDIRKIEKNEEKVVSNFQVIKKVFDGACEGFDFVFIDLGIPLDVLLTSEFPELADVFFFVCSDFNDLNALHSLQGFLSKAFDKTTIVLKSKSDLKKKKTLMSNFSTGKPFIEVCGVDRRGFDDVYKAVSSLNE